MVHQMRSSFCLCLKTMSMVSTSQEEEEPSLCTNLNQKLSKQSGILSAHLVPFLSLLADPSMAVACSMFLTSASTTFVRKTLSLCNDQLTIPQCCCPYAEE